MPHTKKNFTSNELEKELEAPYFCGSCNLGLNDIEVCYALHGLLPAASICIFVINSFVSRFLKDQIVVTNFTELKNQNLLKLLIAYERI